MKIIDMLKNRAGKIFSFEFFPPKTPADTRQLYAAVRELIPLKPSFVSVTHSPIGSASFKTAALTGVIKHKTRIEAMAHLTCISHSRKEIEIIAAKLPSMKIQNILALRGDFPSVRGIEFIPFKQEYKHAGELIKHLKTLGDFCLGAAGYPESHPESSSSKEDILNLKMKVDAGADFIITQLFFDNRDFFDFTQKCRKAGINVPIIPGIMPVTGYRQLQHFTRYCGASIPAGMARPLERIKDDQRAVESYGIEYAFNQCAVLLKNGAPGIHFYTLNKSKSAYKILSLLRETYK